MNLASIDLNLLQPLVAVLEERSVTRAALRLHRSQPAVSASLARLRQILGDDLLYRVGNQYQRTPFAEQLLPECIRAVVALEAVFVRRDEVDPTSSNRAFSLALSDYCASLIGPKLAAGLSAVAPHASLTLQPLGRTIVDDAPESLRNMDGAILPHGYLMNLPHVDLFEDRWVCIVAADNERIVNGPTGACLTMERLAEMPWVVSYGTESVLTPAIRQLQMLGLEPPVQVVVDGFLSLGAYVSGSERVALIQERLIPSLAEIDRLRVVQCPFDAMPLREALWWHPSNDTDPEHIWLRDIVVRAALDLTNGGTAN